MVKAVIFDWNGTLYDDLEKLAYESVIEIFTVFGLPPPTIAQYRQEITSSFMDFYYGHGFVENFSGQGRDGDAKALNEIRKKHYLNNHHNGQIRHDAFNTINYLKDSGIKLGIVSAEIESSLLARLNSSNLKDLFDPRFIKAQVWNGKDIALANMCVDLEVHPNNAIYVDDTVDGTDAAKKAGLISVGFGNSTAYNSEERLRQVTPIVIKQLSELIRLINRTTNFEIYLP